MYPRFLFTLLVVSALVASGPLARPMAAQEDAADQPAGIQVLTRGPVHEAFAETVTYNPQPGIMVAKEPPAAIEELPPAQKPEGTNVVWIPGYWAWDDEQSDFIWVSGVWRDAPPGRQWVPGYWARTAEGVQWTAGYWALEDTTEIAYLPEPPQTEEVGPSGTPKSPDHMWVPGCWDWQEDHYVWVAGYWRRPQPNWVWVPAHYIWTPRGCIFAQGYWDYPVHRRGVLFAPVRFAQPLYTRSGFHYSPTVAIAAHLLTDYLFCRPSYCHYYFGDYYGAGYGDRGIYPWFAFYRSRSGYDPIYAYQRWSRLQQDPNWEQRVQAEYRGRQEREELRPPRTFAAMQERLASGVAATDKSVSLAMPLTQLTKTPENPLRLQRVDKEERLQLGQAARQVRHFREERQKVETQQGATDQGATKPVPGVERTPAPKATPRPTPKAEPRSEPRPEPRPTPKAQPRPERGPEPRPTPRAQPRPEPRPRPTPEVRPEPRPDRRPEPRPERRPEPRAERRPEPRPTPEVRPEPRPERRPEPRAERRPEPRPTPDVRPEPRPERRPESRPPEGRERPERRDRDR